ncbi:cancer/testis antigen 55-like [Meriones unguiculatus]|uniref:cancer/testis antigen 55-like n=1 Tax=Meriones unguiculatus TaxID=10047 RepID=UPI00293F1BA7|nr:cancer/testis antigen 55-like [Meriones unguiculatus]
MHRLILRLRGFFQRKAEPKEQREQQQRLLGDDTTLENLQGVGSYRDYGCINEHSLFSADVSTGKEPLKIEQKVPAVVEEDQTTRRLNTTTVDAFCGDHGDEPSESHKTVLLGCLTSPMGDADCTDHNLPFSLDIVCKDFEPYNGDLVDIEFSEQEDTQSRRAILMKPMKHCHVNKVCITRVDGRTGVLEDTIFFTLDSLKLPSGYVPQQDDIVNVVAVQSIQPNYFWRAVAMTPVQAL